MALVNCPECGEAVNDKLGSCPNCGHKINKKYGLMVQIGIFALAFAVYFIVAHVMK